MANVTFSTVESLANFKSLLGSAKSSTTLKDGGLYFIQDVGIIMRATVAANSEDGTKVDVSAKEYSGKVQTVSGNWPDANAASVIVGALYVKGTTGKISDGSNWTTVFQDATAASATVTNGDTNAVSGDAVYDYIDDLTVATGGTSTQASKVPTLNADGKLDNSFLPALAISEFLGTKTTLAGLQDYNSTAEKGDWAIVDGTTAADNGSYICTEEANTSNSNTSSWQRLADKLDEVTVDAAVTESSNNAVSSAAVYTAISNAALTWDNIADPTP